MTRVRLLVTTVIPALFVGILVGHAAPGASDNSWSSGGTIVADANEPRKGRRIPPPTDIWADSADTPLPPQPPQPPRAPRPPRPPVTVKINGNDIVITGIDELVNEHIQSVSKLLQNPKIPKQVRDKMQARIAKVRGIVDKRLKKVNKQDLDKLEEEADQLIRDIEQSLEGLDKDLEDVTRQLGKHDHDDHDSDSTDTDTDSDGEDDAGTAVSIADLDQFMLKPAQRDAIAKLRADSDARIAAAQKQLDDVSQKLETALADPKTSDAEVSRLVDQVSSHEATIRKARLLAWVQARRVLDADQVKKLQAAVKQ